MKSAPTLPPPDLPAWVHSAVAPSSRANKERAEIDVPDHEGEKVRGDDHALLDDGQALRKRRHAAARTTCLEPLLTVAEAARILNVSERTVRRMLASGAITAVWISRAVRLRPRDIERVIADGGICNY